MTVQRDPGSFRDPAASVWIGNGRTFRALGRSASDNFDWLQRSGAYERLTRDHGLLPGEPLAAEPGLLSRAGDAPSAVRWLEHPTVPFVSYPYEWPFALLKRAALAHLDLHIAALEHDARSWREDRHVLRLERVHAVRGFHGQRRAGVAPGDRDDLVLPAQLDPGARGGARDKVLLEVVLLQVHHPWAVVVGPQIAAQFGPSFFHLEPSLFKSFLESTWLAVGTRYALAGAVMAAQLFAFHLWLAAGRRRLADVWPGIAVSIVLWLVTASVYSYYLDLNDYTRFYAGLSQLMVALIFFQVTAIIIILGAEVNRGLMELKRLKLPAARSGRGTLANP